MLQYLNNNILIQENKVPWPNCGLSFILEIPHPRTLKKAQSHYRNTLLSKKMNSPNSFLTSIYFALLQSQISYGLMAW